MSGPKISVYDLNRVARANLNGQIRCERDCVACAQQINEFLRQATSYRLQIENLITAADLMTNRGVEPPVSKEELQKLAGRLHDESEAIRKKLEEKKPVMSAKYEISKRHLRKKGLILSAFASSKSRLRC